MILFLKAFGIYSFLTYLIGVVMVVDATMTENLKLSDIDWKTFLLMPIMLPYWIMSAIYRN